MKHVWTTSCHLHLLSYYLSSLALQYAAFWAYLCSLKLDSVSAGSSRNREEDRGISSWWRYIRQCSCIRCASPDTHSPGRIKAVCASCVYQS